jgi:ubiquinone/menaquinone biosynthesis C-methylase UbiE
MMTMNTKDAYNQWATTYDSVINKTRDLEGKAMRILLQSVKVPGIIEVGCGTGKNTPWLASKCESLTAVDFSEEMMLLAKEKVNDPKVTFLQADITHEWKFEKADLICFSLVLEHIKDLYFVFDQASRTLQPGGRLYINELHPYKQLQGSRAKFEKEGELLHLEYFIHQVSDYFDAATRHGFICEDLQEWFDGEDRNDIPRLLSFSFRKV